MSDPAAPQARREAHPVSRVSHPIDSVRVDFDDLNLVANAELLLVGTLPARLRLETLVNELVHVRFPRMGMPRAERPHMPDYGVDTPEWEPLPWSWAAERLARNRNFWVVTISAAGRPHALPVWGVWSDDDQRFAFSCGPRSRKARNLTADPRSVVMIDDTVECVSMEGRATTVDVGERQARWIERYLAKYRSISPDLDAAFLRDNLIVEFEPERAFAVIEREYEFSTRATRWTFAT